MGERILLVDDDGGFREVYRELLEADGYEVLEAGSEPQAEEAFARADIRLVILDLMLPPSGDAERGVALGERMLASRPRAKVVVVSGTGETELALRTVERGAYDFLQKPVDPDVLLAVVSRAAARLALEDRVADLETTLASKPDETGLLGTSEPFVAARELAEKVAPTDVPVLITGATGTGKEVFARYLMLRSRRADRPFVTVNCAALPPTLLESTLFGHRKGAFTGAVKDAPGLFVEADGGTMFLDEIGDMEPALQVKLLRALESGEVLPVGASQPTHVDVRLVSATHQPLAELVEGGSFREDLYWRIRGIEVELPSLAARTGDLPILAQHFLNQARALVPGSNDMTLSGEALRAMEGHSWPGNLRQLRHEMQRALVLAAGRGEILASDLSPAIAASPRPIAALDADATLEEQIAVLERRAIVDALRATEGNKTKAAERLGLSRQGLLNKIERHGIA